MSDGIHNIQQGERINSALAVHAIKIAVATQQAKVDAEIKEPYKGILISKYA